MKSIKNLLPEDTRILELSTGLSAIMSLALYMFGIGQHDPCILFVIVGILQLSTLVICEGMEKLRVLCSLLMGAVMVYLGITNGNDTPLFTSAVQIVLGFGNFYAFLLNNQGLKWK